MASDKGFAGHGSCCQKDMHVQTSHIDRKHKACVGPKTLRRDSKCVIKRGSAPKKEGN